MMDRASETAFYGEMIDTAKGLHDRQPAHQHHLDLARQFLAKATDEWWQSLKHDERLPEAMRLTRGLCSVCMAQS